MDSSLKARSRFLQLIIMTVTNRIGL